MKISNFRLIEINGRNALSWTFKAQIDVTTGIFRKKTITKDIFRPFGGNWFFVDTGKYTPGYVVIELERSFKAKYNTADLELCPTEKQSPKD